MKQIRTETGICHFRVQHSGGLVAFLAAADLNELGLHPDEERARRWLSEGCVYLDGARVRDERALLPGQVIRLHTRRKRYPAAQLGGWRARIVADTRGFLVIDKPSGLPAHATLDNFVENAKYIYEQELGQPLYSTHRLDIPTSGLLILAKTAAAQAGVNKLFAKGLVVKLYRAASRQCVPLGLHTHYVNPETRVPREISVHKQLGWWECRLEVRRTFPGDTGCAHEVRLLTGKTHQIRAQFAALGAPLLGDTLYGGEESGEFGLRCTQLAFTLNNEVHHFAAD